MRDTCAAAVCTGPRAYMRRATSKGIHSYTGATATAQSDDYDELSLSLRSIVNETKRNFHNYESTPLSRCYCSSGSGGACFERISLI